MKRGYAMPTGESPNKGSRHPLLSSERPRVPHAALQAGLLRALKLVANDDVGSLSGVSLSDLRVAVSTFLGESRLGESREASSSRRKTSAEGRSSSPSFTPEKSPAEVANRLQARRKKGYRKLHT